MTQTSSLDVIEIIIDILKDNFQTKFKEYFYGDPIFLSQSQLPCVVVDQTSAPIQTGSTGMDNLEEMVTVMIIINKKDDFGGVNQGANSLKTIKNYMYGVETNSTTNNNQLKADTVIGLLRTKFTMGNIIWNQGVNIEFGIANRGKETDIITAEAHAQFTIKRSIFVNNRV